MLNLVVVDASGRRSVSVPSGPFTIGRSSDTQLQLNDAHVSRRHAELVQDGANWRVRDLGSRGGTFVNDTKIEEAPLKAGDRIRIGDTELRIETGESSALTSGHFDFRQVNALLAGLRALGSGQVLDEVLAIVLDSTLELTGAERGFILLAEPGGQLVQRLARGRGGITLTSAQTSKQIPNEVFTTGVDRIVSDLLDDANASRHGGTLALGIRHVLCTPLKVAQYGAESATEGGERRIGVLYLDSREKGYLQAAGVLHALAAEAAVVIENARLYQEAVQAERAAQELRIASEIQKALLPPDHFSSPKVELVASTTPCRSVGGDLFDYVPRDEGSLSFTVADVAGKGTSAALLTAVVQGLLAGESEAIDSPSQVCGRLNRSLCRRAVASRFVTVFYGQLHEGGKLRYCNAGHNAPFLVTSTGLERLETGGTVVGLFDFSDYDTGETEVHSGDLLVVFSDGLTEAVNAAGDEFEDERLAAVLETVRGGTAADALTAVLKAVTDFAGSEPPRDDMTVMVLRFA
ncbi:MAG TPA: SpoIIE family protein phosphatase [Vicinamibacterales bacterium]|nr:SpoIIE family protein phosphatase [Vicinamibacterales bacterium]